MLRTEKKPVKDYEAYGLLLKHPRWKRKRSQILDRDEHTCLYCNTKTNLQVHHRQYHISKRSGNFKDPWNYPNRYLVTLCIKCHKLGHEKFKVNSFYV
jgi:5-methylcytosine-specific restriction endonuclease McrA